MPFLGTESKGEPSQMDSKSKFFQRKGNTLRGYHSPLHDVPYRHRTPSEDVLASKTNETKKTNRFRVKEKIRKYARESPVSGKVLENVARCESNFRQSARGKAGEIGIFQYKISTFNHFKKEAGKPHLSIHSAEDQIELTVWALENGYAYHWTCYKLIY